MTSKQDQSNTNAKLRRRAEEVNSKSAAQPQEDIDSLSAEEIRRRFHELRVHQIEMEMQNEELSRAQVELDATRARYFDLYDMAPVGYCTISEKGLIQEANLNASNLLGLARGALIRERLSRFILTEDEDIYYRLRKQLLESSAPQSCELRMVHLDGTVFWVHLSATLAQDKSGKPVSLMTLTDITERKRAETLLHRKQAMMARTEKIAQVGSWEWDVATDTVTWSDQLFSIFQLEPTDLAPSFAEQYKLYRPEDMERLKSAVKAAVNNGTPYELELRTLRKGGTTRVCLARGQVEVDQSGRSTRLVGSLQDITELKQAENKLRERDKRLHFVLENCHIGSWEFDLTNNTVTRSPEHSHIFGDTDSTSQWSLERFLNHVLPEDRLMVEKIIRQGIATLTDWSLECRIQRNDGTTRWISANGRHHINEMSGTRWVVGVVQDITENKESYQRVFENKMIAMCIFDLETLQIIEVNDTHVQLYGYSRAELLGEMKLTDLSAEKEISTDSIRLEKPQSSFFIPLRFHKKKDGTIFPVEIVGNKFMRNGRMVILCMVQDISRRKFAEEQSLKAHGELERKVLERTADLEKTNATLAMMLDYARKTEADIQERVVANLRSNILGIVDVVKKEKLTQKTLDLLELLESTTRNMAHPLARNLESKLLQLTTREIQLANFIRLGKSTKEVMALLNVTVKTVEAHRTNLRKKLGIHRKKINLRTFLNSEFSR